MGLADVVTGHNRHVGDDRPTQWPWPLALIGLATVVVAGRALGQPRADEPPVEREGDAPEQPSAVAHLWRRWQNDDASGLAAEVAFFAVLSVFPALIALAAAIGFLDHIVGAELAARAERAVLDGLGRLLTDEAAGTVRAVRELFRQDSGGVLSVAVAGAVWSSSRGALATLRAIATVYGVRDRRTWWRRRLLSLALALGTIVTVAVTLTALVVGPLFGRGQELADTLGLGSAFAVAWSWARVPVAVAVVTGWLAVLFHLAPDRHRAWRWDLPGAAVAAVSWIAFSLGLRLYLGVSAATNQVFGVLGGALVVLIWTYLLSLGLLLGAVVNTVILERRFGADAAASRR